MYDIHIMNSTIINFTTDPKLKAEAQKVAKQLGIPLSLALNNYLKELIRTKTVIFSEETPNAYFRTSIKQSESDIKTGKVISFTKKKDVLRYLDGEIEDEKKSK
jgi:addiction module RelB/DinJ family antitoxin